MPGPQEQLQQLAKILRGQPVDDPRGQMQNLEAARSMAAAQMAPRPKQSLRDAALQQAKAEDLYGSFDPVRARARVGDNFSEQDFGERVVKPAFIAAHGRPPKNDNEVLTWYSNLPQAEAAKFRGYALPGFR